MTNNTQSDDWHPKHTQAATSIPRGYADKEGKLQQQQGGSKMAKAHRLGNAGVHAANPIRILSLAIAGTLRRIRGIKEVYRQSRARGWAALASRDKQG
eukprot:scaffold255884_cov39-Tisochrysis_lutea.AAC.1